MQSILFIVSSDVVVKNHATDNTKVVISINNVNYTVDGHDLIIAANSCMMK